MDEQKKKEEEIIGIKKILTNYSLELDDTRQDLIENDGFYYEYARRIYNAGYRLESLIRVNERRRIGEWLDNHKETTQSVQAFDIYIDFIQSPLLNALIESLKAGFSPLPNGEGE